MKPFTNSKGFSLVELIVAAGISVIVGGIGSFVLIMAVETYTRMVRQYEAESEMASAMLAVSATLSNAQKMTVGGNIAAGNNSVTNRGATNGAGAPDASYITRGRLYASYNSTATSGDTFLVGYGITESGVRSTRSALQGFGLFYQQPTETRSGAIYIDKERNAGGWVSVSPVNATQSYGRLLYFGVTDIRSQESTGNIVATTSAADATSHRNNTVLSATFTFQMRYFTKGKVQDFYWCPSAAMTTYCNTKRLEVSHYDIAKNLKVVFANQETVDYHNNNHTYLADRVFGKVYFFKFLPSIR